MDLIEALEKTKLKYPDLKSVGDFKIVLDKSLLGFNPLVTNAREKLKAYLGVNKEIDDFDKFIAWVKSRIPSKPEYKKGKGQRSMSGSYGKSRGKKGSYPTHCSTCGTKLPVQYIVNCPKCTRSIL